MSEEKKLVKNIFIYGIGLFGSRIINILLLPFYTKMFVKSDYGFIDLVITGSMLVIMITTLKLPEGVYRFLIEKNNEIKYMQSVISSALNIFLINFFLFSIIFVGFNYLIQNRIPYASLIVSFILIRMFDEYCQQVTRSLKKPTIYSMGGIIFAISLVSMSILFIGIFKQGIQGFLISSILAHLIAVIYKIKMARLVKYFKPVAVHVEHIIPILKYSLPLLPAAITWWVLRMSGRYILCFYNGLDDVGIYSVADKLPAMIYIANLVFYMAWQDIAIRNFSLPNKNNFFSRIFNHFVQIAFSVIIVCVICMKAFFAIMVSPEYLEAMVYTPYLLLAIFVLAISSFYSVLLQCTKNTKTILYSSLLGMIISILFNIIFVPKYGIFATTFSALIAAATILMTRVIQIKSEIDIFVKYREIGGFIVLFLFAVYIQQLQGIFYLVLSSIVLGLLIRTNFPTIKFIIKAIKTRKWLDLKL